MNREDYHQTKNSLTLQTPSSQAQSLHKQSITYYPNHIVTNKAIISLINLQPQTAKLLHANIPTTENNTKGSTRVAKKVIKIDQKEAEGLLIRQIYRKTERFDALFEWLKTQIVKMMTKYQISTTSLKTMIKFKQLQKKRKINHKCLFREKLIKTYFKMKQTLQKSRINSMLICHNLTIDALILERRIFIDSIIGIQVLHQYSNLPSLFTPHRSSLPSNSQHILIELKRRLRYGVYEDKCDQSDRRIVRVHMQACYPDFFIESQQLIEMIGRRQFSQKMEEWSEIRNYSCLYMCHSCRQVLEGHPYMLCTNKIQKSFNTPNMYNDPFNYHFICHQSIGLSKNMIHPYMLYYKTKHYYKCNRAYCQQCFHKQNQNNQTKEFVCDFCRKECRCSRCRDAYQFIRMMAYILKNQGTLQPISDLMLFPNQKGIIIDISNNQHQILKPMKIVIQIPQIRPEIYHNIIQD